MVTEFWRKAPKNAHSPVGVWEHQIHNFLGLSESTPQMACRSFQPFLSQLVVMSNKHKTDIQIVEQYSRLSTLCIHCSLINISQYEIFLPKFWICVFTSVGLKHCLIIVWFVVPLRMCFRRVPLFCCQCCSWLNVFCSERSCDYLLWPIQGCKWSSCNHCCYWMGRVHCKHKFYSGSKILT